MGKARLYMRQYCQGVHENKSCFEMKRMKTLESDPKEHSKKGQALRESNLRPHSLRAKTTL